MNAICCSGETVSPHVKRALAVICASVLLLAGCQKKLETAADQPVPVRLQLPHHVQQPVSVAVSGSVEANITALTAFQVGGRVSHVYVEEGQRVTKGQILADLDSTDYRNAFNAATGEADAAAAVNAKANAGLRHQELEQTRIDFERTQDEYQRLKYLYDTRVCRPTTSTRSRRRISACRLPVARSDFWVHWNAPNRCRSHRGARRPGHLRCRSGPCKGESWNPRVRSWKSASRLACGGFHSFP